MSSLILIAPRFDRLSAVLRAAFEHPWVASYQIGFGPPLVRANARLAEALKPARGAFDKLDAYVRTCLLEKREQGRLAYLHRLLVVRRHGPMEADAFALLSSEALDLSLRLHAPSVAPAVVAEQMIAAGVPESLGADQPPEALSGRFLVQLDDPRGERWLDREEISALVPPIPPDSGEPMALELRFTAETAVLWEVYAASLAAREGLIHTKTR